ncbi:hypothetical protein HK102_001987 [Quaeritorhiza haematococci]|nr:hypothetical protein HK102_001987 [Quaeritorhiza haematococci]
MLGVESMSTNVGEYGKAGESGSVGAEMDVVVGEVPECRADGGGDGSGDNAISKSSTTGSLCTDICRTSTTSSKLHPTTKSLSSRATCTLINSQHRSHLWLMFLERNIPVTIRWALDSVGTAIQEADHRPWLPVRFNAEAGVTELNKMQRISTGVDFAHGGGKALLHLDGFLGRLRALTIRFTSDGDGNGCGVSATLREEQKGRETDPTYRKLRSCDGDSSENESRSDILVSWDDADLLQLLRRAEGFLSNMSTNVLASAARESCASFLAVGNEIQSARCTNDVGTQTVQSDFGSHQIRVADPATVEGKQAELELDFDPISLARFEEGDSDTAEEPEGLDIKEGSGVFVLHELGGVCLENCMNRNEGEDVSDHEEMLEEEQELGGELRVVERDAQSEGEGGKVIEAENFDLDLEEEEGDRGERAKDMKDGDGGPIWDFLSSRFYFYL